MQQRGEINLHLILTIFLGIGMLLFGFLAITTYQKNTNIEANLAQTNAVAASQAATKQKHADDVANAKANELPYKTYTAPAVDGAFQLQFPKNWSVYSAQNPNGGTASLEVLAGPNTVTEDLSGNAVNNYPFRLRLLNSTLSQVNQSFDVNLKNGTLASKSITVSGISAGWLKGAIDTQHKNSVIVTMQVRDKVMTLETDGSDYLSEFQTILNNAKIHP